MALCFAFGLDGRAVCRPNARYARVRACCPWPPAYVARFRVVVPALVGSDVHRTQFPLQQRIVDAGRKSFLSGAERLFSADLAGVAEASSRSTIFSEGRNRCSVVGTRVRSLAARDDWTQR